MILKSAKFSNIFFIIRTKQLIISKIYINKKINNN